MPPKPEPKLLKYLRQREEGGKKELCPNTHGKLVFNELRREREERRNQPDYQAPQPEAGYQVIGQMQKGGMIKKTGVYKLHKGEMVVPAKNVEKVKKMMKSGKKRV